MQSKSLNDEYVVASPDGKTEVWKSEDFWKMAFNKQHPDTKYDMGYLMSQFTFEEDWDSWEIHPNGDEIVFCISGRFEFILEVEGPHKVLTLEPGKYLVVPKNM